MSPPWGSGSGQTTSSSRSSVTLNRKFHLILGFGSWDSGFGILGMVPVRGFDTSRISLFSVGLDFHGHCEARRHGSRGVTSNRVQLQRASPRFSEFVVADRMTDS